MLDSVSQKFGFICRARTRLKAFVLASTAEIQIFWSERLGSAQLIKMDGPNQQVIDPLVNQTGRC